MTQSIPQVVIDKVLNSLGSYNGKLWEPSYYELHEGEDGDVLSIRISLLKYPSPTELEFMRSVLAQSIHPNLPIYPATHSWIANLIFRDEFVDSIMGGMNGIVV